MNTTQTTSSPSTLTETSRGFGRLAARTTVGNGPRVIHTALNKARVKFAAVDSNAFVDGWTDERRALREGW